MVKGYKCFNKDMINSYGLKFEIGKKYKVNGKVQPGINGNGFHFCTNIEDTFRYFYPDCGVEVCEVIGTGDVARFNDEYNGYFDMYAAEELTIVRKIEREEIIQMALKMSEVRVCRFIQSFKLTPEEIKLFEDKFSKYILVLLAIEYYQKENTEVYRDYYESKRRR